MKKILLVGAALSLLSTSALASQARLISLGMNETDNDGMYHISDKRNIFLNPAWLNVYNNYVTAEFGKDGAPARIAGTEISTTVDRNDTPKAQGGFFKKHGDMVYGIYLGAESNTSSLLRAAGTSAAATVNGATNNVTFAGTNSKMLNSSDNQFDLFVAGDAGIKWGGNLSIAHGKDESRKATDLGLATRWGVMTDRWDAHINLSLASKSKATDTVAATGFGIASEDVTSELKGKLGLHIGGSYVLSGNNRIFGYGKHYSWEQKDSFTAYNPVIAAIGGQQGTVKGDFTSYHLGWGTHYTLSEADTIFVSFSGKKTDINAKFNNKGEIRHLVLPISVAFEKKALEWLTVRGSVTQSVWSQRDNKNLNSINPVARGLMTAMYGAQGKGTVANTTDVRTGATLTFGQMEVDALVGLSGNGQLDGDDLFSRAAFTYNF